MLLGTTYSKISLIGVASGWGAQIQGTEDGPIFIQNNFNKIKKICNKKKHNIYWDKVIFPTKTFKENKDNISFFEKEQLISSVCKELEAQIIYTIRQNRFPIIIGGDHSLAIGTWSGIAQAYNCHEQLGLIWIDAHMDAHTPCTSLSQAIHGMPLAVLMGYGSPIMLDILQGKKVINPKHLVLVGVRSFEEEEKFLLERLGVKIYFIAEVLEKGFEKILEEALDYLLKHTNLIGISLDLDVFEPKYVPGTGSKESNGLLPNDFLKAMKTISFVNEFIGLEIMEFNPHLDKDSITFNLISDIIKYMSLSAS